MVQDLSDDAVLGNEGNDSELAVASGTNQRVDLVGDDFILHLLQRVWS